jgi:hypothetical protein
MIHCATRLIIALLLALSVAAYAEQRSGSSPPSAARYTFSWPLGEADALKPRGGTTRGAPVTLDSAPSKQWQALQQPGLSPFERDRRAILAMAGEYRVTFDFLEVAAYDPAAKRDRPYQSWGTERIYVDRDEGRRISLLHILAMRTVKDQRADRHEALATRLGVRAEADRGVQGPRALGTTRDITSRERRKLVADRIPGG